MNNSDIRLPPSIRKRIKQLATERDTSQTKIIEEAIELLEKTTRVSDIPWSAEEQNFLETISVEVYKTDPTRKQRVKALSKPNLAIEDVIIQTWSSDLLEER